MKIFGLTPPQVLDRSRSADLKQPRSLPYSILYGSIGFGLVSVFAYAIWAFKLIRGQGPMYTSIALVYLLLSGWVLGRLAIAPRIQIRFTVLFAIAFFAYALLWCAFWFGFKGQHHGDFYGSAFGLLTMTLIFKRAFDVRGNLLSVFAVLFTFHTLGYYIGEDLYAIVGGPSGRLLWGAAHGLGFGAGLGNLIHHCQLSLAEHAPKTDSQPASNFHSQ